MGKTWHLFFAVAVASTGSGFQHGYNTGVLNIPHDVIKAWIIMSHGLSAFSVKLLWSVVVSIYCLGGIFGGLLSGIVANKIGRKNGMIMNNALVLIGAVFEGICQLAVNHVAPLIIGRFVIGINCGINAGVCIMYLVEISPVKLRGAISSMYQFNLVVSVVMSQMLSLKQILGDEKRWPYLLMFVVIPAGLQTGLFLICKESPRYLLVNKGNEEKAYEALVWFGSNEEEADIELQKMKAQMEKMNKLPPIKLKDFCIVDYLKKPFTIAILMMLAQQFSGINAVTFYSTEIFKDAGIDPGDAKYCTIGAGLINLAANIVSLFLIDRAGRRKILLISYGGMVVITTIVMICVVLKDKYPVLSWASAVMVYIYITIFAIGSAIPWFLVSEMFDINARPIAASVAVAINWLANFCVGLSFEPIEAYIGGYVFLMYIVCQILSFFFILFYVPETKNRPIEEVVNSFKKQTEEKE